MKVSEIRDIATLERMHKAGLIRLRDMPEYWAWNNMRRRCYSSKDKAWKNYGGRGIKVCDKWNKDFWTFLWDVGLRPNDGTYWSIDRINNDGNYEPSNVRWATAQEQAWNHRYTGVPRNLNGAKLDWTKVREIRALRGLALQQTVADDYGVSPRQVSRIWRNEDWIDEEADLTPYDPNVYRRAANSSRALLSEAQAAEVKFLALEGLLSMQSIGDLYGVSGATVSDIKLGRSWPNVLPKEPTHINWPKIDLIRRM